MRITVVIAAILVVTCAKQLDIPIRCCFPKVWEGMMATVQIDSSGMKSSMLSVSYDFSVDRFALQDVDMKYRIVVDYSKMIQYVITSEGLCSASKVPNKELNCIPDNATFVGSVVYGGPGGMVLDKWSYKVHYPPVTAVITVTRDACVYVSEVGAGTLGGVPFYRSDEFSNITYAIKDPTVFNVPSPPCPSDQDNNLVGLSMP
ncbi:uncharacterized protein [Branchiostoma lanceolatum]|uniref:uncharacterized protein isoform X2 n=1 Tax=Branchiostoma lanceolatum TaxID=7740 RepID=UPI00345298D7